MSRSKGKGQGKYNPKWITQQASRRFNLHEKWKSKYTDALYRKLVDKFGS